MSKIVRIVVHCTGEPANAKRNLEYYRHWFLEDQGWRHYGYHAVVYQDGSWEYLQPLPSPTKFSGVITDATLACGQPGTNNDSIHVAYVGGLEPVSKLPKDTRTPEQKKTLAALIRVWKKQYNITVVIGHRDWPGVNKACPCFDAKTEYLNA